MKQEVQELFPTPIWIVDLEPLQAASLNLGLKAEINRLISPRPVIPPGSNWQTPQDLHTKPAFAEFVKLVETAARGVTRFLQVDQYPMTITGCWANINPPGAYHPTHHHPNNYLSGVYYVAVPPVGSRIVFQDPRPSMIMPKPKQYTRITANGADAQSKEGRLLIFPAWLKHTVPSNEGHSERISISFNLMFKNFTESMAAPLWEATAGKEKR
ncbi:MAG: TIGR02466 family protein [Reyranellales bacterium]